MSQRMGRPLYGRVALFERMSLEALWPVMVDNLRKRRILARILWPDIDKIARHRYRCAMLLADDGIAHRAKD